MPTTPNPENEVHAELELQFQQANDDLRDAYLRREELGARFWLEVSKLEEKVDLLGRQLTAARRDGHPVLRPRLTPAPPVENKPRAVTETEVPAVVPKVKP